MASSFFNTWLFSIARTVIVIIIVALLLRMDLRIYRRISTYKSFSATEQRILIYQLLAVSLWMMLSFGILLYVAWFGSSPEILDTGVGKISLVIIGWIVFGFVGLTSIVARVTFITDRRGRWHPVKGRAAVIGGIIVLGVLVYGTWDFFST